MINIALLGFGVIGSGTAAVIDRNRTLIEKRLGDSVRIKYILDLRDFPGSPYADRVVHDFDIILGDSEISVVAEMMGGIRPAADFTEAALRAEKSVVTSNKAVVAACGDRLLALAREKKVRYLFEASVGGGIPVIRPMVNDLAANRILSVRGILNGTTNYILTKMTDEGVGYAEALSEAQRLGYAEKDPTADVEGFDTARKILILSAVAWGKLAPLEAVRTRGISDITADDIRSAAAEGYRIKLVAEASIDAEGRLSMSVCPRKVGPSSLLFSVNGVFNAVEVTGNMTGRTVFYGQGAGSLPTASAVVSDIIDAAETPFAAPPRLCWSACDISETSERVPGYLSLCD
jgi:Homoserine dehydrogenase